MSRLMSPDQVSELTGLSTSQLLARRVARKPPEFTHLGGDIKQATRYYRSSVEAWVEASRESLGDALPAVEVEGGEQ